MGILHEDVVIIKQTEKEDEATVITINCPDKTGLGCDLCRIILFFGLSIVRGGIQKFSNFFLLLLESFGIYILDALIVIRFHSKVPKTKQT